MQTLASEYPTAPELLAASAEEVAAVLLDIAADVTQAGAFWPPTVDAVALGNETLVPATEANPLWHTVGVAPEARPYGYAAQPGIDALLAQAWGELRSSGAVVPAWGMNGANGWLVLGAPEATGAPPDTGTEGSGGTMP